MGLLKHLAAAPFILIGMLADSIGDGCNTVCNYLLGED